MDKDISDSKRLSLVYLQELFLRRTDETHYVKMPEILSFLEKKDIFIDRRTVYTYFKLLNYTGFDIVSVREKGDCKYHHPQRIFDITELKFLIDSIAASKFLTEKKSKELIDKVKSLASDYDNAALNRGILLGNRVKSINNTVLSNLDSIYAAIADNSKITFQYMRWNSQHKLEYQKGGTLYNVSPYAVSLNADNYYLIAYDNITDTLKHYRIDKMKNIRLLHEEREGKNIFKSFNPVDYTLKTFGMYGGREEIVSIKCPNSLVGVFIDRFGYAAHLRPDFENSDKIIIRISVNVSPQFYAWLFALGTDVKIISPDSVIDEFVAMTDSILNNYRI